MSSSSYVGAGRAPQATASSVPRLFLALVLLVAFLPGGLPTGMAARRVGAGYSVESDIQKDHDANVDTGSMDTGTADSTAPVTVTYQIMIANQSTEPAVIGSVSDDVPHTGSTCAVLVGTVIGPQESIRCTFDATFDGDGTTNVETFTVTDPNDAGSSTDAEELTLIAPSLLPAIQIDRSASRGPVSETGGGVAVTVTVTNQSTDSLTLDALIDDLFGDFAGVGTCSVPQTLAANGGNYQCSFTDP